MPESWSGNFVVDTVLYREPVLLFFPEGEKRGQSFVCGGQV